MKTGSELVPAPDASDLSRLASETREFLSGVVSPNPGFLLSPLDSGQLRALAAKLPIDLKGVKKNLGFGLTTPFKSIERIMRRGGTSSWRLDRNHARQCAYVVCTRNTKRDEAADLLEDPAQIDDAPKTEAHQSAFLVGKISNIVLCPRHGDNKPQRYLIQFSEYARVTIPDAWKGDRNPVKYGTLKELGIDPSTLKWEPMPAMEATAPVTTSKKVATNTTGPLTMAEAKKGLALTFGVPPDAIEITIRG